MTETRQPPAEGKDQPGAGAGPKFVLVFVALTIAIVALGTFYYRGYERDFRTGVENQLSAIADLKVRQVVKWREERMADGLFLFRNSSFSAMVRRFFAQPTNADARRQLLDWLGKYPAVYGYDQAQLMDAQGSSSPRRARSGTWSPTIDWARTATCASRWTSTSSSMPPGSLASIGCC